MQVRHLSPLLTLRSVRRSTRCVAKLPDPLSESAVGCKCQYSSLSCDRPKNVFRYQLPHDQLLAEYRVLEAKCKILRTALHQTSKKWQTQSPKPPCSYTQRTLVECPSRELHQKKSTIQMPKGALSPRKKYPCLSTVFLCKVLTEDLQRKKP